MRRSRNTPELDAWLQSRPPPKDRAWLLVLVGAVAVAAIIGAALLFHGLA